VKFSANELLDSIATPSEIKTQMMRIAPSSQKDQSILYPFARKRDSGQRGNALATPRQRPATVATPICKGVAPKKVGPFGGRAGGLLYKSA